MSRVDAVEKSLPFGEFFFFLPLQSRFFFYPVLPWM